MVANYRATRSYGTKENNDFCLFFRPLCRVSHTLVVGTFYYCSVALPVLTLLPGLLTFALKSIAKLCVVGRYLLRSGLCMALEVFYDGK